MYARKIFIVVFWILMIGAPALITICAIGALPPGTEQVPMQVGFNGEVNRWGTPSEFWLVGGIMSGVNLLLALSYRFCDALFAMGLVNGVKSPRSARIVLMVTACAMVLVTAWCFWFLMKQI